MNTKTQEFILKAKQVHGEKYDYRLVEYKGTKYKVKIICKIHGLFEQDPYSHYNGCGCPHCVNKTEGKIKEFLIQSNIEFETQSKIDNKKFDFLINNDYILEIDGAQHFPTLRSHQKIPKDKIISNDIQKMESIIDYYPIVRLFQEDIWNNKYDWKTFILNLKNLEVGILYIRKEENDIYTHLMSHFDIVYL